MIHEIKPPNLINALSLWMAFPGYCLKDVFQLKPVILQDLEIKSIHYAPFSKKSFIIHFHRDPFDCFIRVSSLPPSLSNDRIAEINIWTQMKDQWPVVKEYLKNSLIILHTLALCVFVGLCLAIFPNLHVLVFGSVLIPFISTFLYYRFRAPKVRNWMVLFSMRM
jgi:hypothetical protein